MENARSDWLDVGLIVLRGRDRHKLASRVSCAGVYNILSGENRLFPLGVWLLFQKSPKTHPSKRLIFQQCLRAISGFHKDLVLEMACGSELIERSYSGSRGR